MPKVKETKNFFPYEDNPERGDYIEKVTDPRQTYYAAKPMNAEDEVPWWSSLKKKNG